MSSILKHASFGSPKSEWESMNDQEDFLTQCYLNLKKHLKREKNLTWVITLKLQQLLQNGNYDLLQR